MDDLKTNDDVLLRYNEPGTGRAVVLDDDGRVAYAYLLDREAVVSDVWLYNVTDTPNVVDWNDESQMPFLNPQNLCKAEAVPRLSRQSPVNCIWTKEGVDVVINDVLMARLKPGAKPGWSRLARLPGPLANPL